MTRSGQLVDGVATGDPDYVLGRSESETRRLMLQARLFDRFTKRFLEDAGLREGMRVLDVGSGAGDVALVAAELVGPRGEVVGVDVDPAVLGTARARARERGWDNVTFVEGDCRRDRRGGLRRGRGPAGPDVPG